MQTLVLLLDDRGRNKTINQQPCPLDFIPADPIVGSEKTYTDSRTSDKIITFLFSKVHF